MISLVENDPFSMSSKKPLAPSAPICFRIAGHTVLKDRSLSSRSIFSLTLKESDTWRASESQRLSGKRREEGRRTKEKTEPQPGGEDKLMKAHPSKKAAAGEAKNTYPCSLRKKRRRQTCHATHWVNCLETGVIKFSTLQLVLVGSDTRFFQPRSERSYHFGLSDKFG